MTKPSHEVTVRGRVTWLYHSSPAFTAGVLTTDDGRQVRFRGGFLVQAQERVTLTGVPITHRVYGEQLDVRHLAYDLDLDVDGLAAYLANNPSFHGIGPARATAIAQAFGADFDRVIREDPAQVRAVAPISDEDLATLQREWLARAEINALASWLSAFGLTHCQLSKIVERYGHQAKALLTTDPYLLCGEVAGFGFARTDEVARKLGVPDNHPGRLAAALRDQVGQARDDGHCWVDRTELVRTTARVLALDDLDAEAQVATHLDALIDAGDLAQESDGAVARVALVGLHRKERDLRACLQLHGRAFAPRGRNLHRLSAHIHTYGAQATRLQRRAVRMALGARISLITGAAGSGKSYTIALLADVATALSATVALCAPTGKAAKRLEEVTGCRATTLHRLLGYNGRTWAHDAEHPLDVDVVVLDEASMADVDLAWRLVNAIDFARTQLVLVGDHQQLPPVGAGNLLRDLLQYDYLPVCVLDQVIRQAGTLKENASAILEGTLAPTAPGMAGSPSRRSPNRR